MHDKGEEKSGGRREGEWTGKQRGRGGGREGSEVTMERREEVRISGV